MRAWTSAGSSSARSACLALAPSTGPPTQYERAEPGLGVDFERGLNGYYREPDPEVRFRAFTASLIGHAIAFAKMLKK